MTIACPALGATNRVPDARLKNQQAAKHGRSASAKVEAVAQLAQDGMNMMRRLCHQPLFELQRMPMKSAHDLVSAAKARVHEVPIAQADQALLRADVLLDVRESDEFAGGHLPGAIHVARGVLEFKLSGTPALAARDLKVVLYCKTSGRAALAAAAMQDMGYLDVVSIAGGFDAWLAAGRPVVKPDQPTFD